MARKQWLIQIRFWAHTKFFRKLKKQTNKKKKKKKKNNNKKKKQKKKNRYLGKSLFYHEIVCCVYSLESSHQGDSNEYTQCTIMWQKIESNSLKYRYLLPDMAPWLTLKGLQTYISNKFPGPERCSNHWNLTVYGSE